MPRLFVDHCPQIAILMKSSLSPALVWLTLHATEAFAQAAPTPPTSPSTFEMLVVPAGFLVLMYIVFIRPQAKKFKEQKKFIDELKPRDTVVTSGGLVGRIKSIHNHTVELDVGCGVMKVMKSHISEFEEIKVLASQKANQKANQKADQTKTPKKHSSEKKLVAEAKKS